MIDFPLCETNYGPEGILFTGLMGTVIPPVHFDKMKLNAYGFTAYLDIRFEKGVAVYPGKLGGVYSAGGAIEESAPAGTRFRMLFVLNDETIVHKCEVNVVDFDPKKHSKTDMAVGECNLTLISGVKEPMDGHLQILELPEDTAEAWSAPEAVADVTPLTSELLSVYGQSKGLATVVWLAEKANGDLYNRIGGICPIEFANSTSLAELRKQVPMCLDINGAPLSLNVGDSAQLHYKTYRRNISGWHGTFMQKNSPIAVTNPQDVKAGNADTIVNIEAKFPRTISLVRQLEKPRRYEACLVAVN